LRGLKLGTAVPSTLKAFKAALKRCTAASSVKRQANILFGFYHGVGRVTSPTEADIGDETVSPLPAWPKPLFLRDFLTLSGVSMDQEAPSGPAEREGAAGPQTPAQAGKATSGTPHSSSHKKPLRTKREKLKGKWYTQPGEKHENDGKETFIRRWKLYKPESTSAAYKICCWKSDAPEVNVITYM
jgi:hypothetical protein